MPGIVGGVIRATRVLVLVGLLGAGCAAPPAGDAVTTDSDPSVEVPGEPVSGLAHGGLRLLSHEAYRRSMQAVLGTSPPGDVALPAIATSEGFTDQTVSATVSPLLFDAYERLAAAWVGEALRDPADTVARDVDIEVAWDFPGPPVPQGLALGAEVGATGYVSVEQAGDHVLTWRTSLAREPGDPILWMSITVDGVEVASLPVDTPDVDTPVDLQVPVTLSAGLHVVRAVPSPPLFATTSPSTYAVVWSVDLHGPVARPNPGLATLVPCNLDDDAVACIEGILARLQPIAWRRPLDGDALADQMDLVGRMLADGLSPRASLDLALRRLLTDARFLFRIEPGDDSRTLDAWEVATRVAYTLTAAPPDAALRAVAADGSLLEPAVLAAQVERLLQDPASEGLAVTFLAEWWQVAGLETVSPDPMVAPSFTSEVREGMREELLSFARTFVGTGRSVDDMLLATDLPRDARVTDAVADRARAPRVGLLSMPGLLAVLSHPDRTSPTRRGKFVVESLLCDPPDAPPANLPPLPPDLDERERSNARLTDPSCRGCHTAMDPVGLALESFDPIGAAYAGTVDATASLEDGTTVNGVGELAAWVVADARYHACVVDRAFTFTMGRAPSTEADRAVIRRVAEAADKAGWSLDGVMAALLTDPAFVMREGLP